MSFGIDTSMFPSNSYTGALNAASDKTGSAEALKGTLSNLNLKTAEDEELMEACKSFEAYFVEQVFKGMQKMVKPEGEENQYLEYFGDMMVQDLAGTVADSQSVGIAQMLYESMKRN